MAIHTGEGTKSSRNSKISDAAETAAIAKSLGDSAEAKEAESKKSKEFAEPLVADCEVYNLIADMAPDTYFSVPCVCENGNYKAVAVGGDHTEESFVAKIAATAVELVAEKNAGLNALKK